MKVSSKRKHRSKAERLSILHTYEQSEQTQEEFCKLHKISPSTLWRWRQEHVTTEEDDFGFVEVGSLPSVAEERYEIQYSDIIVRVPSMFDSDKLKALMEVMLCLQ